MKLLQKIRIHIILWFTNTSAYLFLIKNVVPFIRFSLYYTSFRGWKYHKGYSLLKPGDIILAVDTNKATSAVISKATAKAGGRDHSRSFVHAGLCVSKDGHLEIVEMTHRNYTRSCFFDMCKEAERIAIVRCKEFTPAYINTVLIPTALSDKFAQSEYNWKFEWSSNTSLYCSQLIYRADAAHKMDVDIGDLIGLGVPYISPEGLYDMKNGTIVWDSDSEIATPEFF